jgi:hypothetical protein
MKLRFNCGVWPGRRWNHVIDTLPNLIEAIKTGSAPTLEHLAEPGCGRIQYQRSHTLKRNSAGSG